MAESKCEFSSETEFDDPAIEQWVVDNCEAVGEAIDNLFHDDYIGEWNVWQDTGNRLTAHVDTGSNAMGYMATVAHAPYNWGKLFDHAMAQLPSGDTTEVAAQDAKGRQWGATSVTAVYEMIATDLQPKYKDHENAFILASMGGSPSMMDEKLKLAEADIASVKFLVAALETQVPSATAPLTPAQEAAGWNNEHRLGSNEYGSLVWFKTLVGYLETILSDLRIVVDELLRLKKSWDEVFFNNHDAATKARDAFHA